MILFYRRKERICLVLVGILLVSLSAGLSAATARSVQGAFDVELARHWRTDYDLVVRHPDSVSESELVSQSLTAKFQSNHFYGVGITKGQLATIRSIEGVEVAAPLAIVGPAVMNNDVGIILPYDNLPPGVYQEEIVITQSNGIEKIPVTFTRYFVVQDQTTDEEFFYERAKFWRANITIPPWRNLFSVRPFVFNIVAVDFEAEAVLHGLDSAMLLGSIPQHGTYSNNSQGALYIPMIVNNSFIPSREASGKVTRLTDLPPNIETVNALASSATNLFIKSRQEHVMNFTLDLGGAVKFPALGEHIASSTYLAPAGLSYKNKDGQVALEAINLGGGFGISYFDQDIHGAFEISGKNQWFRPVHIRDSRLFGFRNTTTFIFSGVYDPDLMNLSPPGSPIAAPMEIYRTSAEKVLKGISGSAVPANTYAQNIHPYDFVGTPIGGLISIHDALDMDEATINSVRVKVSGVDSMNEASQMRIAYVAQKIRELTGLHVDIVLGSSLQRRPVHLYSYSNSARDEYVFRVNNALSDTVRELETVTGLPVSVKFFTYDDLMDYIYLYEQWQAQGPFPCVVFPFLLPNEDASIIRPIISDSLSPIFSSLGFDYFEFAHQYHRGITILIPEYQIGEDEPRDLYGVVEQYWIKLGAGLQIYEETNRGTFWITLALLAVGALFIGNTTYISAVGRIGEFSVLRSLGWRRSTVFRVSLFETLLISILAGLMTAGVLALVWHYSDRYMESWVLLLAAPVVILTFLVGSIPPLVRTIFIPPLQGSRQGELKSGTRIGGASRFGFVLRGLALRPGRSFVTILAMIIPGGTLAFIYFIYFGIQSVLGETMLGEYLAVELQGYHFVLNALVFAVAGLAVTDTLLINLRERQKEFGLLKAVGWRSSTVASLLFWEGVGLGLVGGIIGTVAAGYAYVQVFGLMPPNPWLNGPILMLIPALVGGLAAVVPAIRAARIPAAEVIRQD